MRTAYREIDNVQKLQEACESLSLNNNALIAERNKWQHKYERRMHQRTAAGLSVISAALVSTGLGYLGGSAFNMLSTGLFYGSLVGGIIVVLSLLIYAGNMAAGNF